MYLLGGGEDGPQRLARDLLARSDFSSIVHDGASVFAVCAGLQILGTSFSVEGNDTYPGLGLVDVTSERGTQRSVGDMAVRVGEEMLVGFENHGGITTLGSGVAPLGHVVRGRGNDGVVDGFRTDRIVATYAHGPALAQNPWLADQLLSQVLGHELEPWVSVADQLHTQRIKELGL
jgi:CobQ-like glutamine amidotransferase family enzyme